MENRTALDVEYPIYGITSDYKRTWSEFNILYIETRSGIFILDNTNIEGDTLGKRRIRMHDKNLYIPRAIILNVEQLVNSKYSTFIDATGFVFKYKRANRVKLIYYKTDKVNKVEDGCIVTFKKTTYSVKTNCRNAYGIGYVGLLQTNAGQIPYEYTDERKPDTWRKV